MNLPSALPPPSRSWKDIRQGVNPHVMSRAGRRRMTMASVKFVAFCVFGCGCAWAAFTFYQTWKTDPAWLKEPVKTVPLKQVVFTTDGVLDQAWVGRTLALPKTIGLMALDLTALESRLLSSGQVQGVIIRRRFADYTLVVTLQERAPIMRVMVQAGNNAPGMQLVARDGVIYEGAGYEKSMLDQLPWLDGVRLHRTTGGGFEPVEGMDRVAELLGAARTLVPQLCAGWTIVSLARFTSDQEIVVRSAEIPTIVFDLRGNFPRQLWKLDVIVERLRQQGAPPVEQVNLALGDQVPVGLQNTVPLAPARPSFPPTTPPTRQKRDF
jgi:hypothetical protein